MLTRLVSLVRDRTVSATFSTGLLSKQTFSFTYITARSTMSGLCCVDPGAKQSHAVQGSEEKLAGISTYKTGKGKSAIVIFSDVFGHTFINIQKVADTFALATGTTVLIPDLFKGDPMDPEEPNLWDKLPEWRKKHPVEEACSLSVTFISAIKANYKSIQVIGFCYGAKPVVHLVIRTESSAGIIAAIAAHPSLLVKEEAAQIKRPILFLCAEKDQALTPDLRDHFEKTLAPTGLGKFIDYPGTTHGFAIRPDGSEQANKQKDKAIQDAIEFFKKNL